MSDPLSVLLSSATFQFIGNLGKDPEIRYLKNSSVTHVNIAIKPLGAGRDAQANWIKLEIWGESGQAFADQLRKGQRICVAGQVKTDQWTDRSTGEIRKQICCRVEQWRAMGPPPEQQAAAPAATGWGSAPDPQPVAPPAPVTGWGQPATPSSMPMPSPATHPPAAPAPASQAQPPVWQSSEPPW